MKQTLLCSFALVCACTSWQAIQAQSATAFAITGATKGNVSWSVIREIDITTGALVRNIYTPATEKPSHKDAVTGKLIAYEAEAATTNKANPCGCGTEAIAAASAYDMHQKRLYFTPIFGDDLQYIDMTRKELVIYHVGGQSLKSFTPEPGEGDNITRMAFGSDGNGYAITNNGNHFMKITTGKNIKIAETGSLTDKSGNAVSVHAKPGSWGGDLVADDAGSLYLFTVGGHVFKINPAMREAAYSGSIKNLPASFTVNAAAVDKNGNVTVASSIDAGSYYSVNMATLEASAINGSEQLYNASDFANSNLLATEKSSVASIQPVSLVSTESVTVSPNPVKNKLVTLYFNGSLQGRHTVEVLDVNGKKLAAKTITVAASKQAQTLQLPSSTPGGLYVVHVMGNGKNVVYTGNVVVE